MPAVETIIFDVRLTATLGKEPISVSMADVQYGRDAIPSAVLMVPVGKDVASGAYQLPTLLGGTVSVTPGALQYSDVEVTADIRAPAGTADLFDGGDPGFPLGSGDSAKPFVIFRGYAVRHSFTNDASGNAAMLIECAGQLVGLSLTTQLLRGIARDTPIGGDEKITISFGQGDGARRFLQESLLFGASGGKMADDIWLLGLRKLIDAAVKTTDAWGGAVSRGKNNTAKTLAAKALDRLKPAVGGNGGKMEAPTLRLAEVDPQVSEDAGIDAAAFRKQQSRQMAKSLVASFYANWAADNGAGDMWDSIESLRQEFLLHFVSTVEEDALIPLSPTQGGDPWRELSETDIFRVIKQDAEFDPRQYQEVSRVGLYGGQFDPVAGKLSQKPGQADKQAQQAKVLGYYEVVGKDEEAGTKGNVMAGRIRVEKIPDFLTAPPPSAMENVDGVREAGNPKVEPKETDTPAISRTLGNLYCAALAHDHLWEGRSLQFLGRFRMDICPGSLLKVPLGNDAFKSGGQPVWGNVATVRLLLQAGNEAADSACRADFQLSHVRSDYENRQYSYAFDSHPLFPEQRWAGAKLI